MLIISRRQFLQRTAAAAPAVLIPQALPVRSGDPWDRADAIVKGITIPTFPARDFDITKYGAVGDGAKSCTDAIRKAIGACRAAGGGRVIVPDGRFLTGPVRL